MKPELKKIVLIAYVLLIAFACKRDDLDLDKNANRIQSEREIAIPLVLGEFSIQEFIETDEDSLFILNGDTVSIVFREDSLLNLTVSDLVEIPEQGSYTYTVTHDMDILVTGTSMIDDIKLENDTIFTFNLGNSMRIDSMYMNTGQLDLNVINTYNHTINLVITSVSLIDPDGSTFSETITDIPPMGTKSASFDISNYTIKTFDQNDSTAISIKFHPIVYNTENEDWIYASDELKIEFSTGGLNDFNAVFGFLGYNESEFDTILFDLMPEEFEGISGTFSATNPKINLIYSQSFGIETSFDLYMEANHTTEDIIIDPPTATILASSNYLNPLYSGRISWNKNNVSNIDELIAFPIPNSLTVNTDLTTNYGADAATTNNFALWDSKIDLGLEIEIPLEIKADLTYLDTFKIDLLDDDVEIEVDRANLEYWFLNYFPMGFDAYLVLLDTIANITLDTIYLNPEPGNIFLQPAPVDANGDVLKDEVEKYYGAVTLSSSAAQNLMNVATHIIVQAELLTTDYNSARIGADSKLQFQFGLDAKATYTTY